MDGKDGSFWRDAGTKSPRVSPRPDGKDGSHDEPEGKERKRGAAESAGRAGAGGQEGTSTEGEKRSHQVVVVTDNYGAIPGSGAQRGAARRRRGGGGPRHGRDAPVVPAHARAAERPNPRFFFSVILSQPLRQPEVVDGGVLWLPRRLRLPSPDQGVPVRRRVRSGGPSSRVRGEERLVKRGFFVLAGRGLRSAGARAALPPSPLGARVLTPRPQ